MLMLAVAGPAGAQTDFYNTDAGRPVSIEDAYPVERYAFELQLAPIRLERAVGGVYAWQFEPELAYGLFPRTQIEVGLPIHLVDSSSGSRERGLGGIDVSVLHNLNVETAMLPGLALALETLLPVGSQAPDDVYGSVKAIASRTFHFARIHLNGEWTWGPEAAGGLDEVSRWMAGVAVDRTFPLRSALLTAAAFVEQPLFEESELVWTAEAGLRYQWSPTLAVDAGVSRRISTDDPTWAITFGAAYAFAIRSLIPTS